VERNQIKKSKRAAETAQGINEDHFNQVQQLGNIILFLDDLMLTSRLSDVRKLALTRLQDSIAARLTDTLEQRYGSHYPYLISTADNIITTCENNWDANKSDCNAFVKSVAKEYGVLLSGVADDIVDTISGAGWEHLGKSGVKAKASADDGNLVIGGLKGQDHDPPRDHGHVVIVVRGSLANGKYPTGYWGSLGGVGKKNTTLNYAWNAKDRDHVIYGAMAV
jgi:hypothetical protein